MVARVALVFAVGLVGIAAGAGLATIAVGASEAPPATHPQIVSSSTGLQSFLWVYDDAARMVTFCFTAASPPNGPQYDFSCRRHAISEAISQN